MELTPSLVASKAREYLAEEPLADVEATQVETLPAAFADGEFHWRDAEWVVRWYFRRFLGEYPGAERRAAEEAFRDNEFEAVRDAVVAAARAEDAAEKLDRLTALDGVDVPVASAWLAFLDPDSSLVVGEREWSVLSAAGELSGEYPDPPTAEDYRRYLAACRELTDRLDCSPWTLYRALWRLAKAG